MIGHTWDEDKDDEEEITPWDQRPGGQEATAGWYFDGRVGKRGKRRRNVVARDWGSGAHRDHA